MVKEELARLTIREAAEKIRTREISSIDLTEAVLHRISQADRKVKAYVTVMREQAEKDAAKADELISRGEWISPLHGIPFALKDLYNTAGTRTTCSSKVRAKFIPREDSGVTEHLRAAGAVIVGKSVTHEFAYGVVSPPTCNPWDLTRIPGGSSGGSGAAIAADLCIGSTGTDTGGSIRIPSSFCGIAGIKPTYGRVSKRGVAVLSWTLDHTGPMCKTVEDTALSLNQMAGYDPRDHTTIDVSVPDYTSGLTLGVRGLKIGVPKNYFFDHVDPDVEEAVRDAIKLLRKQGAEIREITIPYVEHSPSVMFTIAITEATSYHEETLKTKAPEYQEDVRTFLELGELYLAKHYLRALKVRKLIHDALLNVFENVDVLATPTTPAPAAKQDQKTYKYGKYEESVIQSCVRFTSPFNCSGLPAMSIPCGFSSSKLPLGLQIVGKPFDEETVFRVAATYEANTDWHTRTPPV